MKKFLVFILILAILTGLALYFGWAQAKVPPGSYAVLRSKTHGTYPDVITSEGFLWIWYKLIPDNTQTLVFTPRRMNRPLDASGSLPSGRRYAMLAGIDADFLWNISGEFSFIIKPDILPVLTEEQNLADTEAFIALEDYYAGRIEDFILQRLRKLGENLQEAEDFFHSLSLDGLEQEVQDAFPGIDDFNCFIRTAASPDFELYHSVKTLYDEYLTQVRLVMAENVAREAESRISQRIVLNELTLMGELLTEFPILLEYMTLDRNITGGAGSQ